MILMLALMIGPDEGVRIEIDTADERCASIVKAVDQPGLLMLTVAGRRSVPADVHRGVAPREQFQMRWRSPKGVRPETRGLVVRAPKDEPNIEAATRSAFEHVKCTPTTARHTKR
jgi:hypothetical protein